MSQELDFEQIKALMEVSDKKFPMRTPTDEKSALSMVDDPELKELIEKKSDTYVSKGFVDELKGSEIILRESKRTSDMLKTLNEKIQSLDGQIRTISEEKRFYQDLVSLVKEHQKFIQNV